MASVPRNPDGPSIDRFSSPVTQRWVEGRRTSGLDPVSSNELSELLKKLASNGAAVLMASHDLFRVRETCNRIGILKSGKLVKEMDANDITSSELESVYINFMKK